MGALGLNSTHFFAMAYFIKNTISDGGSIGNIQLLDILSTHELDIVEDLAQLVANGLFVRVGLEFVDVHYFDNAHCPPP